MTREQDWQKQGRDREHLADSLAESLGEIYRQAGEATKKLHGDSLKLDREFQEKLHTYHTIREEESSPRNGCCHCPPPESPDHPHGKVPRRRKRRLFQRLRLMLFLLVLIALLLCGLYYWPLLQAVMAPKEGFMVLNDLPEGIEDLMPDPEMGYSRIDFQNAILGETREKSELVVREQDIQVDSQISQALVNLSVFEKTKIVHSFGVGVYTVDLSKVTEEGIDVDLDNKHITVTIPRAVLRYVEIDPEKTTFEDTDRAFLAFGDITLTSEQQQTLQASVQEKMREHLASQEQMDEADGLAREKVFELLNPVVQAISEEFTLLVRQGA